MKRFTKGNRVTVFLSATLIVLQGCAGSSMQIEPAVSTLSNSSQPITTDITKEYISGSSTIVPNQILIISKNSQRPYTLKDKQLKVERSAKLNKLSLSILQVGFKSDRLDKNALQRKLKKIKKERPDLIIQPNYIYYVDGKKSTSARKISQYALKMTGLNTAASNSAGRGIKIALIDTPVDSMHPALKSANIKSYDYVQSKGKRHGTAIAGILVGRGKIQGVVPGAKLISIGAFNEPKQSTSLGLSTSFILGKAFNKAIEEKVDLINLSFGSTEVDPLMRRLTAEIHAHKILLLASVGNDSHKTSVRYPAAFRGVYAITAIDANSKIYKRANTGNTVDYALPGVSILTSKPGGKYTVVTGTSFANAYATGIFALQLSQKRALKELNKKVLDLGQSGKDKFFGRGLMRF